MNKIDKIVYKSFREKVYEDYTEFKELCFSASSKQVYMWSEQIAFRESVTYFLLTDTNLEETFSVEECEKIMEFFKNRIIYGMYLFWEDSDFFAYDYDTLVEFFKSYLIRVNDEDNTFFAYMEDFIFKPYQLPNTDNFNGIQGE